MLSLINKPQMIVIILFLCCFSGCLPNHKETSNINQTQNPTKSIIIINTKIPNNYKQIIETVKPTQTNDIKIIPINKTEEAISPDRWQEWPIIPSVTENAKSIYRRGIDNGNDSRTFSVFGDCQSLPDLFWGVYDSNDYVLEKKYKYLQETIENFSGSFARKSPTVKKGTTMAAVLWEGWIDSSEYDCLYGETPLECEVRIHKPSIVLINLGTHWEYRNEIYFRKMLDTLITNGILPILSTKADNREGDERLNLEITKFAYEYKLPLWNFWRAAQDLPNAGLDSERNEVYLTKLGLQLHRFSALQALDSVWRAVR